MDQKMRVAVLGAGGLGKAAAHIMSMKRELCLSAICDSRGLVMSDQGLNGQAIASISGDLVEGAQRIGDGLLCQAVGWQRVTRSRGPHGCPQEGDGGHDPRETWNPPEEQSWGGAAAGPAAQRYEAHHYEDPLQVLLERAETLDGILVALPNMPNEFIPSVIERFTQANASLVFVDVLKRTRAVELMFALDEAVKRSGSVVMTGCGATPGLLAAAAVLASQSFIEVEKVKIWWGVGIANWEAYRATIREDIAHLPGYNVERANAMTDAEVDELLDRTDGLLELHKMEHADDLLLQRVGVVDALGQVEVGGVMDTRHPKKPVSTTMSLTGITFEGKRSTHTFTLGDETTMAANVIGPALGYLKRGMWLKARNLFGVFGCTDFLPMVVR